ncbi:MAG: sigma-70 family RNA polymerase sigma factor [Clostridia bacterium]|nr:sigma-70 family RNA polymerase sigma factor [Clostridia bacterium]
MPRHVPDDHTLLETLTHALGSGDAGAVDRAFESIYNAYARSVAFVCGRYLSDDTDIRSVTNDVFISFFQRSPYIEEVGSLRAYLMQSARHAALDFLRSKNRRERRLTELTPPDGDTDPLTLIPDPDGDIAAHARYRALTDDLRATVGDEAAEIVLSHAVCGESFPAIAARLGLKTGTVKTRYHRAIQRFRKQKGDAWL